MVVVWLGKCDLYVFFYLLNVGVVGLFDYDCYWIFGIWWNGVVVSDVGFNWWFVGGGKGWCLLEV